MWQIVLPLILLCSFCKGEPDNSTLTDLEYIKLIDPSYGVTWMFLPDGNDTMQIAYLSEEPRNASRANYFDVKDKISFQLYNRKYQKDGVRIRMTRSLRSARKRETRSNVFDPQLETKFLIHGWQSSKHTDTIQSIKDNYLKVDDMNVIAVDWSELAANIFYFTPVVQTREVGETIAEMINHLVETRNASLSRVHIVGHSLGAHCAGFAGRKLGGRVGRISGLDPANPGFEGTPPSERLDPTDAQFVDVIHTSAGTAGISMRCGHIDFYPNGGARQPNCNLFPIDLLEACSHGRSHQYFAESIFSDQFISYPCRSWAGYKANRCGKKLESMGEPLSRKARGVYYLETNGSKPYAKGKTRYRNNLAPAEETDDVIHINKVVKLFFYRKNHVKTNNTASFVPNGIAMVQMRHSSSSNSRKLFSPQPMRIYSVRKLSLNPDAVSILHFFAVVDWSLISEDINYMRVANLTNSVGMYVAEKIKELVREADANVSRFHIIGHSLGAHIAGFAGAQIKSPQVSRITGLDPALPNFQRFRDPDLRLDASDAAFVDIIHTSGGTLRSYAPIGMADFYVNGGTPPQPGCGGISELATICSHGRAVEYFLESIDSHHGFWGMECESWSSYKSGDCRGTFAKMGASIDPTTRGIFYLGTNYKSPFAMGRKIFFENEPFWRSTLNTIIHQTSS
ncbi:uncharacterized protein LOC132262484 [Phlebotomus argentipes]|uniref:uncharacterized protein LOC132262484 n=1 Tax=Phlebotomus argentipes TaxID=94469 RepID=UPI002892CE4D|nr:uncharacterized protein LOC132262484 [Phlebotomus argentipes]